MLGYSEREPASCELCGGHPDDCACQFAGEDLAEFGPPDFLWCEACHRTTVYLQLCDEHGANRMLACSACRRIARFY